MNNDEMDRQRSERVTRLVNDSLEEMHVRRKQYREAKIAGAVTMPIQASFQASVVGVYDELHIYQEDVEDMWEEYKLERVDVLAHETTTETKVITQGGRVEKVTQEEPYRIPCSWLLYWSHAFDHVARDLGFAAATKTKIADPADAIV
ncbi:hypothetical protein [Natronorubrum halophilum]|uniref:hypothetical protein n=1 Tax=Natronorubrum halophilum TaxID=1702106 RepID=UPI0013CF1C1F|nr:hypothetical protein [Natronorubrum halophilum]